MKFQHVALLLLITSTTACLPAFAGAGLGAAGGYAAGNDDNRGAAVGVGALTGFAIGAMLGVPCLWEQFKEDPPWYCGG